MHRPHLFPSSSSHQNERATVLARLIIIITTQKRVSYYPTTTTILLHLHPTSETIWTNGRRFKNKERRCTTITTKTRQEVVVVRYVVLVKSLIVVCCLLLLLRCHAVSMLCCYFIMQSRAGQCGLCVLKISFQPRSQVFYRPNQSSRKKREKEKMCPTCPSPTLPNSLSTFFFCFVFSQWRQQSRAPSICSPFFSSDKQMLFFNFIFIVL